MASLVLLALLPACGSEDDASGGSRKPLPRAKDYPILQYHRRAYAEEQDQVADAFLILDTGLLTLVMGPHVCELATRQVLLTDDELGRGRALFSLSKIEDYRSVGGIVYDDRPVNPPPTPAGEPRKPIDVCNQPQAPNGVSFTFQLPGNYSEWHQVMFRAGAVPAIASDAVAFMRELEAEYHP